MNCTRDHRWRACSWQPWPFDQALASGGLGARTCGYGEMGGRFAQRDAVTDSLVMPLLGNRRAHGLKLNDCAARLRDADIVLSVLNYRVGSIATVAFEFEGGRDPAGGAVCGRVPRTFGPVAQGNAPATASVYPALVFVLHRRQYRDRRPRQRPES